MRRVIAIAVSRLNLAGCSSFSPTPPTLQIQLESTPPGADARTSMGQGCKTPCAVNVPIPETDFSVSYTLNDFQPVTVPVRVSGSQAGFLSPGTTRIDPNPVVAELQPVAAAEAGPHLDATEKADEAQRHRRGTAGSGIGVAEPRATVPAASHLVHPLIFEALTSKPPSIATI
jgi:hypothetical protein